MFDASVFWPAFRDVGLLKLATATSPDSPPVETDAYLGYVEPDRDRLIGPGRSKDYEIEFQAVDLPDLGEGWSVTIWTDDTKTSGTSFVLREDPFVHSDLNGGGDDGTFKHAILTRV